MACVRKGAARRVAVSVKSIRKRIVTGGHVVMIISKRGLRGESMTP